jgi:hypothetical protein
VRSSDRPASQCHSRTGSSTIDICPFTRNLQILSPNLYRPSDNQPHAHANQRARSGACPG